VAYTKYNADWKNAPDTSTPITEAAMDYIENGIALHAPDYATTLPGSPSNGKETILVDSTSAPTYHWRLRYNSTTAKWHYIGGTPAFSQVLTAELCSSTTYVALTTAGPSFALPVAGDYIVEIGTQAVYVGGAFDFAYMSYDIGGTGAVDADAIGKFSPTITGAVGALAKAKLKTGLTAVTLTAKYKTTGTQTLNFFDRWMRVTPVKIG
jgi:hypothetical protein